MPEVKRFVKEDGQANGYKDVTIEFVGGHSPVFIEYDDSNTELSMTDMSGMKLDQMHELLRSKGFERRVKDEL